jgi:hypothetical protein
MDAARPQPSLMSVSATCAKTSGSMAITVFLDLVKTGIRRRLQAQPVQCHSQAAAREEVRFYRHRLSFCKGLLTHSAPPKLSWHGLRSIIAMRLNRHGETNHGQVHREASASSVDSHVSLELRRVVKDSVPCYHMELHSMVEVAHELTMRAGAHHGAIVISTFFYRHNVQEE